MDLIIGMLVTFITLVFSIFNDIFVGYSLILGYMIFCLIASRKGHSAKKIISMSYKGCKDSFIVIGLFVLIGLITGIWMSCGTVPAIIYYGMKFMNLRYFILYAFLITSVVSFLLGTSFGSVSTVGVALILIAKNAGLNADIVAGAIISGAYFGDRCSPMSSSANLVANLTKTNIYTNVRNMFKTSIVPYFLTCIAYLYLSVNSVIPAGSQSMSSDIVAVFDIKLITLLPAIMILVFAMFKVDVKISMLCSIVIALLISVFVQKYTLLETLGFGCFGYHMEKISPLQEILKGGGIISMLKASIIILVSCAISGIFKGTNMLTRIEDSFTRCKSRFTLFIYTSFTSVVTAIFGCNQSISVIMTYNIMDKSYREKRIDKYKLAIDIENTAILIAALIPWNTAALVPTATMKVSMAGYIPYAFYLYLGPLMMMIEYKFFNNRFQPVSLNS